MFPEQKALVKATWFKVAPMADAAACLFYDRLFEIDPTTRPLFKTTDLAEQRRKLVQALTMVVQGLDHLEALVPTIADLGRRHVQFGVTDAHYEAVGAALLWTLEQGLGSGWTPEAKVAWSCAYALLADVMRATTRVKSAIVFSLMIDGSGSREVGHNAAPRVTSSTDFPSISKSDLYAFRSRRLAGKSRECLRPA